MIGVRYPRVYRFFLVSKYLFINSENGCQNSNVNFMFFYDFKFSENSFVVNLFELFRENFNFLMDQGIKRKKKGER